MTTPLVCPIEWQLESKNKQPNCVATRIQEQATTQLSRDRIQERETIQLYSNSNRVEMCNNGTER